MVEVRRCVVGNLKVSSSTTGIGLLSGSSKRAQRKSQLTFRSYLLSAEQRAEIAKRLNKAVLESRISAPFISSSEDGGLSVKSERSLEDDTNHKTKRVNCLNG